MAISANTVWELRTTGSDTNGGGFVAGASGTDYSQQDAKNTAGNNISTTDAVANGSTTITSATASFTAAIVGNIVYFSGGTGSIAAQWRQVTVFTDANTITIDTAIAASTGMTMNIGGALASPGQVAAVTVSTNTVWQKSGTYLITSTSSNVSGGVVNYSTNAGNVRWEGYNTSRGDLGTAPICQASGISSVTLFQTSGSLATILLRNVVFDGQSLTSIAGLTINSASGAGTAHLVTVKNCTNGGFSVSTAGRGYLIACAATGCSSVAAFTVTGNCFGCEAYANSVAGFSSANALLAFCISRNNSGASSDGFIFTASSLVCNCTAYANGRDGFRQSNWTVISNCYAEGNTGVGFDNTSNRLLVVNCFAYNNTGGDASSISVGSVTSLASSALADASNGNMALNNGAGASLRGTGFPGIFADGLTTGFLDVGAAQHQDPLVPPQFAIFH